jgi:hypothetical protein
VHLIESMCATTANEQRAVKQACGVVARGREMRTHIEQDMRVQHVCVVQVVVCANDGNDTECGDRWALRVQLIESKCQLAGAQSRERVWSP